MSVASSVGFLRGGLILAVLKAVGNRPELRVLKVLISGMGRGKMSPEMWMGLG